MKKQVRMYFHEGSYNNRSVVGANTYPPGWMGGDLGETLRFLENIKRAGFNTVCIQPWDGSGALGWVPRDTSDIPINTSWSGRPWYTTNPTPWKVLLDQAEKMKIDVIAWFNCSKRNFLQSTQSAIYAQYRTAEAEALVIGSHPNGFHDMGLTTWRTQLVKIAKEFLQTYPVRGIFWDYIRNPTSYYTADQNGEFIRAFLDEANYMIGQVMGGPDQFIRTAYALHETDQGSSSFHYQGRRPVEWLNSGRVDLCWGAMGTTTTPFSVQANNLTRLAAGAALLVKPIRQGLHIENYDTGVVGTGHQPGATVNTNLLQLQALNPKALGIYLFGRHTEQLSDALRAGIFKDSAEPDWSFLY